MTHKCNFWHHIPIHRHASHRRLVPVTQPTQEGKAPLPAALYLSTPWSDLSGAGDTYRTLARVDNTIVTYDGALGGVYGSRVSRFG